MPPGATRLGLVGGVLTSLALLAGPGVAGGATDYCASLGLTNATVRPILGPHVSVNIYPNQGQDLGDCLIYDPKSRNASADVEVYPAVLSSSLTGAYGGGAKTHKHAAGLTSDAELVTGKNNGYRHGGPTVLFTTANAFVTIDGYPAATVYIGRHKHVRPATTAGQVTRLAQLVYPNVR
jgi:hypothetical protein